MLENVAFFFSTKEKSPDYQHRTSLVERGENLPGVPTSLSGIEDMGRLSKFPKSFRNRKSGAKNQTLTSQSFDFVNRSYDYRLHCTPLSLLLISKGSFVKISLKAFDMLYQACTVAP